MFKQVTVAAALVLGLAGCATLPSESQVKDADHGTYPDDYEKIIKTYYAYEYGQPETIMYRAMSSPKRYWIGNRLDDVYYGYLVCVTLNTKNILGEYSGFRTDAIMIKNDIVTKQITDGDWWGEQLCPETP